MAQGDARTVEAKLLSWFQGRGQEPACTQLDPSIPNQTKVKWHLWIGLKTPTSPSSRWPHTLA
jgi:hypothetical protein